MSSSGEPGWSRKVYYWNKSSVGSDHRIVTAELKLKLRATKNTKKKSKHDWSQLIENQEIKAKYNVEVRNRFDMLNTEDNTQSADSIFQSIVTAHKATAEAVIPKLQKSKPALPWENTDIITKRQIVKEAQKMYANKPSERNKDALNKALEDLKLSYDRNKK